MMKVKEHISAGGLVLAVMLVAIPHAEATDLPQAVLARDRWQREIQEIKAPTATKYLHTGTDRGGSMAVYAGEQEIYRVLVSVGLSTRTVRRNYYFERGSLVLVTSEEFSDADVISKPDSPTQSAKMLEERFYFDQTKLICSITIRLAIATSDGIDQFLVDFSKKMIAEAEFVLNAAKSPEESAEFRKFVTGGK